ncbi:crossover junction endodeoxyribonuclease RuvC [Candidatus Microgenomates bacterium]|nr:MAG: crossover junction endodeoxyribonuclease RuvC [Candidatus Microgenomates bacterium]
MIILGIDPGTATTGWGVVEKRREKVDCLGVGIISTPAKTALPKRLATIFQDIQELLTTFTPDAMAVEELFFNTNAKTALSVGHARGVVLLAAQKVNIPIFSYTPLQVKMAISGYGRAEKLQIQKLVAQTLNLEEIPKPDDAADALAVALTHGFSTR